VALLIAPTRAEIFVILFIAAAIGALVVSTRRPIVRATILMLLIGALATRYEIREQVGSDVLDVTAAAIDRVLAGLNPYGVSYEESRPPGSPYPYGPLALLWYVPVTHMPRLAELLSASLIVLVLALQGRLLGLAIYAATPALVHTSVDGSNDTTLGLLIALTFLLASHRPALAGVVLAGAVAFKLSAAAWVPAFLVWGGWRVAAAFGGASALFWSPVLFVWGPAAFVQSTAQANAMHRDMVWSIGAVLRDWLGEATVRVLDTLRFAFGGLTALVTLPFIRRGDRGGAPNRTEAPNRAEEPNRTEAPNRSEAPNQAEALDRVIVAGTLVYLVTLFGGTWATFAYFAAIAPVLCLRVDDWLGLPTMPLVERAPAGASAA
jgi:hypothetical protein